MEILTENCLLQRHDNFKQCIFSSPLAEIGGLLGISLGASFLTIMEIIDFVIFLVANKFSTIKKAKEVQVTQKESGRKNESLVT